MILKRIVSSFYLEFVKKKGVKHVNEVILTNCPNCGADISITTYGKCSYCDSVVVNGERSWVLNKISDFYTN